ncbi:MAG: hypothetical protein IJH99_03355 [Eubacterium sp.]|nr:hypothetical protein [Eubacterium sp.]
MSRQEELVRLMQEEKTKLEAVIEQAEKRLKKAPEGSVRIAKCRRYLQFFLRNDPADKSGNYIPSKEKRLVDELIQKKYDKKLIKSAGEQLEAVNRFLRQYDPDGLDECYNQIIPGVRDRLFSAEEPDEVYAQKWEAQKYEAKPFSEDSPEHFTQKGERVRSKSEVMIANALYHAGIPYHYECPLFLEGTLLHPDFTILRVRDRKTFYWEHLGMIDDTAYRNDAFSRIRMYERNGLFPGDRLLLTAESYRQPLNLAVVNAWIDRFLL